MFYLRLLCCGFVLFIIDAVLVVFVVLLLVVVILLLSVVCCLANPLPRSRHTHSNRSAFVRLVSSLLFGQFAFCLPTNQPVVSFPFFVCGVGRCYLQPSSSFLPSLFSPVFVFSPPNQTNKKKNLLYFVHSFRSFRSLPPPSSPSPALSSV
eukprot:gnl/Hemi2/24586_TR8274_c0_g1_i1.p1 gnl/Hemi2/24586_TR8274_c0_g1~~gnl/Hemi2/24586_TR8274_c0_g1_i1.p1  ORF type:complete len:159 (-),score=18.50 gnl/Hemi2/24586_TR8274_c0_g1_i1:4-456(-)